MAISATPRHERHAPCRSSACGTGFCPTGRPYLAHRGAAVMVIQQGEVPHYRTSCTRLYLREGKGEGQPCLLVLVQDVHLGLDAHSLAGGDTDLHGVMWP